MSDEKIDEELESYANQGRQKRQAVLFHLHPRLPLSVPTLGYHPALVRLN